MRTHLAIVALSAVIALTIIAKTNGQACSSSPCRYSGTCTNTSTGFSCECRGARHGDRCQTHICRPKPCLNKARCKWYRDGSGLHYRCICRKGYSGINCEIDACDVSPCNATNSFKCKRMSEGQRICQCRAGYLGDTCDVDACLPNPCQNGGKCRRKSRQRFLCDCAAGFQGISCDLNACDPNPCLHGGNCIPYRKYRTSVRHQCQCKPGLSGKNCEIDNRVGSFKCQFSVNKMGESGLLLRDEEECESWCYVRENPVEQSVIRGCWYENLFGTGTLKKPEFGCGFFDDGLDSSEQHTDKQVMCFCKDEQCNTGTVDNLIQAFPLKTEFGFY